MTEYYAIKIRKDVAKALPIVLILLIIGGYAIKSAWKWQPDIENVKTTTETKATTETKITPNEMNCDEFTKQLDQHSQEGFKEGYLCQRKKTNCQVPDGLSVEERGRLEKGALQGRYFDAKKYVYNEGINKDYYTALLTGTYPCSSENLELLKKFVYEQQWKAGNSYGE